MKKSERKGCKQIAFLVMGDGKGGRGCSVPHRLRCYLDKNALIINKKNNENNFKID